MRSFRFISFLLLSIVLIPFAYAQEGDFSVDLSIDPAGVQSTDYLLVGRTTRVYATVQNNSDQDLFGVVKFYDEKLQRFIGTDQQVSVVAGSTDDVFVDYSAEQVGDVPISVRVIPLQQEGDNPDNNKVTTTIFVDRDSDGDGTGDRQDIDDDNDGVSDGEDAFPYDSAESQDADGDGLGNNADPDDDNDGVEDLLDAFPLDPNESQDSDGDGVGDNADPFPNDPEESADQDGDGLGDNNDPNDENKGPSAIIETPETLVSTGETVSFSALRSSDSDGQIVSYEWDFGDGEMKEEALVDHVFKKPGDYTVTLTVTDDKEEYRRSHIDITVVHHWQTIALIILAILLFLALLLHLFFSRNRWKDRQQMEKDIDATQEMTLKSSSKRTSSKKMTKKSQKNLPKKKK